MTHGGWTARLAKWGLTAATVLVAAGGLISGTRGLALLNRNGNGVTFTSGWFDIRWGWSAAPGVRMLPLVLVPRYRQIEWGWYPHYYTPAMLMCPGWCPVLACAVPAGLLWRRDRRRMPPGYCQKCGYNLTGNVSGRCPECGEAVPPESARPS